MTTRRGFLWLCGASGTGIFLAKTGLVELPRRMVLQMAGTCSFCGKDRREVFGIAGVVGSEARICDECIGLCFDIIQEERENEQNATHPPPPPTPAQLAERERMNRMIEEVLAARANEPVLSEHLKALFLSPPPPRPPKFRQFYCSFCDRSRRDVRKLISGPRVFICDDCTGDAGGLLAASGCLATGLMSHAEMRRLAEQTRQALLMMTAAEEEELRERYGISEKSGHALEELGKSLKWTRGRIRQIEARVALRKRLRIG